MPATQAQARLTASVRKNPASGCWNWSRQVSDSGLGRTLLRGEQGRTRMASAHRASHSLFVSPIPAQGRVRQTGAKRLRIDPDHFELLDRPAQR